MELVQYLDTHVTHLFNATRGYVLGPPPLAKGIKPLADRYKFTTFPEGEALLSEKIVLRHGEFNGFGIDALEMYNDGTITRGRCNTSLLEDFERDVEEWFGQEYGAKRIETHDVSRNYESNIIVAASQKLLAVLEPLEMAARAISRLVKETNGAEVIYRPVGFNISYENSKVAGLKPVSFRLERKLDVEFDKGLFFSSAPLRTDDHLAFLKQMEG